MRNSKKASKTKGNGAAPRRVAPPVEHRNLDIDLIDPSPFQPRTEFPDEEIEALAGSITAAGQLQPVSVRPVDGRYQLLAGERRLRACRAAGLATVRAEILDADDAHARQIGLVENLHRADLGPIEKARGMIAMIDAGDADGPTALARQLGLAQSTVSNLLRLLELPEDWQARVISREIGERHARAVLPYVGYPAILEQAAEFLAGHEGDEPATVAEFEAALPGLVRRATRTLDGQDDSGFVFDLRRGKRVPIFAATSKQLTELGVIRLDGEHLATNVELWEQLQEEFLSNQEVEADEQHPDATDSCDSSRQDPDDEPAAKKHTSRKTEDRQPQGDYSGEDADRRAASHAGAVWQIKANWLRYEIAEELRTTAADASLLQMCLMALTAWDTTDRILAEAVEPLRQWMRERIRPRKVPDDLGKAFGLIPDWHVAGCAGVLLAESCFYSTEHGPRSGVVPDAELVGLVDQLGLDLEECWGDHQAGPLSEAYWRLHSREQLAAIIKEITRGLDLDTPLSRGLGSKDELIAWLVSQVPGEADKDTGLPMPKELLKAKPPRN